jgi:hypothetical protein
VSEPVQETIDVAVVEIRSVRLGEFNGSPCFSARLRRSLR